MAWSEQNHPIAVIKLTITYNIIVLRLQFGVPFLFSVWVPYFIEEDNVIVIITSNSYCEMLENVF